MCSNKLLTLKRSELRSTASIKTTLKLTDNTNVACIACIK